MDDFDPPLPPPSSTPAQLRDFYLDIIKEYHSEASILKNANKNLRRAKEAAEDAEDALKKEVETLKGREQDPEEKRKQDELLASTEKDRDSYKQQLEALQSTQQSAEATLKSHQEAAILSKSASDLIITQHTSIKSTLLSALPPSTSPDLPTPELLLLLHQSLQTSVTTELGITGELGTDSAGVIKAVEEGVKKYKKEMEEKVEGLIGDAKTTKEGTDIIATNYTSIHTSLLALLKHFPLPADPSLSADQLLTSLIKQLGERLLPGMVTGDTGDVLMGSLLEELGKEEKVRKDRKEGSDKIETSYTAIHDTLSSILTNQFSPPTADQSAADLLVALVKEIANAVSLPCTEEQDAEAMMKGLVERVNKVIDDGKTDKEQAAKSQQSLDSFTSLLSTTLTTHFSYPPTTLPIPQLLPRIVLALSQTLAKTPITNSVAEVLSWETEVVGLLDTIKKVQSDHATEVKTLETSVETEKTEVARIQGEKEKIDTEITQVKAVFASLIDVLKCSPSADGSTLSDSLGSIISSLNKSIRSTLKQPLTSLSESSSSSSLLADILVAISTAATEKTTATSEHETSTNALQDKLRAAERDKSTYESHLLRLLDVPIIPSTDNLAADVQTRLDSHDSRDKAIKLMLGDDAFDGDLGTKAKEYKSTSDSNTSFITLLTPFLLRRLHIPNLDEPIFSIALENFEKVLDESNANFHSLREALRLFVEVPGLCTGEQALLLAKTAKESLDTESRLAGQYKEALSLLVTIPDSSDGTELVTLARSKAASITENATTITALRQALGLLVTFPADATPAELLTLAQARAASILSSNALATSVASALSLLVNLPGTYTGEEIIDICTDKRDSLKASSDLLVSIKEALGILVTLPAEYTGAETVALARASSTRNTERSTALCTILGIDNIDGKDVTTLASSHLTTLSALCTSLSLPATSSLATVSSTIAVLTKRLSDSLTINRPLTELIDFVIRELKGIRFWLYEDRPGFLQSAEGDWVVPKLLVDVPPEVPVDFNRTKDFLPLTELAHRVHRSWEVSVHEVEVLAEGITALEDKALKIKGVAWDEANTIENLLAVLGTVETQPSETEFAAWLLEVGLVPQEHADESLTLADCKILAKAEWKFAAARAADLKTLQASSVGLVAAKLAIRTWDPKTDISENIEESVSRLIKLLNERDDSNVSAKSTLKDYNLTAIFDNGSINYNVTQFVTALIKRDNDRKEKAKELELSQAATTAELKSEIGKWKTAADRVWIIPEDHDGSLTEERTKIVAELFVAAGVTIDVHKLLKRFLKWDRLTHRTLHFLSADVNLISPLSLICCLAPLLAKDHLIKLLPSLRTHIRTSTTASIDLIRARFFVALALLNHGLGEEGEIEALLKLGRTTVKSLIKHYVGDPITIRAGYFSGLSLYNIFQSSRVILVLMGNSTEPLGYHPQGAYIADWTASENLFFQNATRQGWGATMSRESGDAWVQQQQHIMDVLDGDTAPTTPLAALVLLCTSPASAFLPSKLSLINKEISSAYLAASSITARRSLRMMITEDSWADWDWLADGDVPVDRKAWRKLVENWAVDMWGNGMLGVGADDEVIVEGEEDVYRLPG